MDSPVGRGHCHAGGLHTHAALVKILKQPDEWKKQHHHPSGRGSREAGFPWPTPSACADRDCGKPSYNIFIHLGRGINQDRLRHAIVSTLLYEMMLRTVDPEGLPDEVTLPPPG